MTPINFHKKEKPLTSLVSMGGGAAGMQFGGGAAEKKYVEDAFSVDRYLGNGVNERLIENNLDLADGGMTMVKCTSHHESWCMANSANNLILECDNTGVGTNTAKIHSLTNNGFKLGTDGVSNQNAKEYVSFSFKKMKGFFDIQTWTGDNANGRQIAHDLGCVPGCIWIKNLNSGAGENWVVYHRGYASNAANYALYLNQNGGAIGATSFWSDTAPTDTHFTVSGDGATNSVAGGSYIAFLFGDGFAGGGDAVTFGEDEDQSIIKCGGYTGSSSNGYTQHIDLGWKPQFVLYKNVNDSENWRLNNYTSTFGQITPDGADSSFMQDSPHIALNEPDQQTANARLNQTDNGQTTRGFSWYGESRNDCNGNGKEYIYIAIRAPVGLVSKEYKTEDAPKLQQTVNSQQDPCPPGSFITNFGKYGGTGGDFSLQRNPNDGEHWAAGTRSWGNRMYRPDSTDGDLSVGNREWDSSIGWYNTASTNDYSWVWRECRGVDTVFWRGNCANKTILHNLGKAPEMMFIKNMKKTDWNAVYHMGGQGDGVAPGECWGLLNSNASMQRGGGSNRWQDTAPTANHFTVGNEQAINGCNQNSMGVLFTSIDGISKVGYYTGDGSSNSSHVINVGFQPRLLIVKCASAAGSWWLYDSTRGFGLTGDTKPIALDSSGPQSTPGAYVSPTSVGFTFKNGTTEYGNGNGDKYIYYAHA